MIEHRAVVTVKVPVHLVYQIFTRLCDYPKFMSYVKEVRCIDEARTHWVAGLAGVDEWDALSEHWIPDRQIAWRATSGLEHSGRVVFTDRGVEGTRVDVELAYEGDHIAPDDPDFERRLQTDLEAFAGTIAATEPERLDPQSSAYLFSD